MASLRRKQGKYLQRKRKKNHLIIMIFVELVTIT